MSGFNLVEVDNEGFKSLNTAGATVDLGTEATLQALDAKLATIDTALDAILVDTNSSVALLTTIDADTSNLDVALSTRATEATLLAADGRLTTIDAVLDSIKDTDGIKKITDPIGLGAGTEIVGKVYITDGVDDATITHDLIDGKKRLDVSGKVSIVEAQPPPGATAIQISADTPLIITAGITPHDTDYIIAVGSTFTLLTLIGGSEGDSTENGSRIDIVYDNGSEHLVSREYVAGFSNQISPDTFKARDGTVMVGTGTEKIIVRRIRLSGGSLEIDAVVKGFEETT